MLASLPTGPRGRFLALILVFVALGAAYLLVVAPLLDLYAERAAVLENRRMLLPRLQAAADGSPALVVDMTRTRFCDSAGLRVLVDAHKQALAEGRAVLLAVPAGAEPNTSRSRPNLPRRRSRTPGPPPARVAADCATWIPSPAVI